MLASPLASTTGWTWSQDAIADLPAELAGAFPSTAGTPSAPVAQQARGQAGGGDRGRRRSDRVNDPVHGAGPARRDGFGPLDLGPCGRSRALSVAADPAAVRQSADRAAVYRPGDGGCRRLSQPGNDAGRPVMLAGHAPLMVQDLAIVAAFPRRPGLDTLARAPRAAHGLSDAAAPDAAPGLLRRDVRRPRGAPAAARAGGRPVSGRQITIERAAGPVSALFDLASRQCSRRNRPVRATLGAGARLVASAPARTSPLATPEGATPVALASSCSGSRHTSTSPCSMTGSARRAPPSCGGSAGVIGSRPSSMGRPSSTSCSGSFTRTRQTPQSHRPSTSPASRSITDRIRPGEFGAGAPFPPGFLPAVRARRR